MPHKSELVTLIFVIISYFVLVDNRSYSTGLIFYDLQTQLSYLPPTVSVSRGRILANVKYSDKGSIWSTFGKRCDCSGIFCGCCAGIKVKQYNFNQKMCANITYVPPKEEALLDVYLNDKPSAKYGISARNPAPFCIPVMMGVPMAMCVQMSDIAIKGNNLNMCMDFVVRLGTTDLFEMHFQCMQMGLDGFQYVDKNGQTVLPSSNAQTVDTNDDEYYDEIPESENEINYNENENANENEDGDADGNDSFVESEQVTEIEEKQEEEMAGERKPEMETESELSTTAETPLNNEITNTANQTQIEIIDAITAAFTTTTPKTSTTTATTSTTATTAPTAASDTATETATDTATNSNEVNLDAFATHNSDDEATTIATTIDIVAIDGSKRHNDTQSSSSDNDEGGADYDNANDNNDDNADYEIDDEADVSLFNTSSDSSAPDVDMKNVDYVTAVNPTASSAAPAPLPLITEKELDAAASPTDGVFTTEATESNDMAESSHAAAGADAAAVAEAEVEVETNVAPLAKSIKFYSHLYG